MSKWENETELDMRKKQNSLGAAKDNPETDIYESPIEKKVRVVDDDKENEDPA